MSPSKGGDIARLTAQARRKLDVAAAAEADLADQQQVVQNARSQAWAIIADVQRRIEDGESTGDDALDTIILLEGTTSRKLSSYHQVKQLGLMLSTRPGEPFVVFGMGYGRAVMGVVPKAARVKPVRNLITTNGLEIVGATGLTLVPSQPCPGEDVSLIRLPYSSFTRGNLAGPIDPGPVVNIRIGRFSVTNWYLELKPADAFAAWAVSRELPLDVPLPESLAQTQELMRQRETLLVQMTKRFVKLQRLESELLRCQTDIRAAIEARRTVIRKVPTGVAIDFEFTSDIDELIIELRKDLRLATRLQMREDPMVRQIDAAVGIERVG